MNPVCSSGFTKFLVPDRDGRHFYLKAPFPVIYKFQGHQYRFWLKKLGKMPKGYEHFLWRYDTGSIPRFFWRIVSPTELGYLATAVHDYLIEKRGVVELEKRDEVNERWISISPSSFTREEVDKMFCLFVRYNDIALKRNTKWRRLIRRGSYRAVRLKARYNGWKYGDEYGEAVQ